MKWIPITERMPKRSGKFLVKTVGSLKAYATKQRLEARFFYDPTKDSGSFDVNNQTVIEWLDEDLPSSAGNVE